jgi:hypothetical protein
VRRFLRFLPPSLNQSETQDTGDDQKDRYDVIEQLRHDQNKDAGDQGDDRLKVRDAYGAYSHFLIPVLEALVRRSSA